MKTFTKLTSGNFTKLMICTVLISGSMLLQSCKKDSVPVTEISYLSIINTSPTLATFNVYVDQIKANPAALPFGGTIPYFQIQSGAHSVKFTTASSTENLFTKSITLNNNEISSVFLIDKDSQMDVLQTIDQLNDVTSAKAFIRFINLSPDAPALDLGVKGDSTNESAIVISDKAYKATGPFVEIEPKTYIFQIKDKATGTAINKELSSVELKAGVSYTIISRGLLNPLDTDQPFSGQIITNL